MSVDLADKIHVKLLSAKEYDEFENKEIVITNFTVDSNEFKLFLEMTNDVDKKDPLQIREKARSYFSSKNESLASIKKELRTDRLLNNTIYFYIQLAEYFHILFPTYFAMLEYYIVNGRRCEYTMPVPFSTPDEDSNEDEESCECEEMEKNEIEEDDELDDLENFEEEEEYDDNEEIEEEPIVEPAEKPSNTMKRKDIKLPSVGCVPTPQIDILEIENYIGFIPKIRTRIIDKKTTVEEMENRTDAAFKPMKTFELAQGFSRHDFDYEYRDAKNKKVTITITDIRLD